MTPLLALTLLVPAHAGKWDDAPTDVAVRSTIAASAEDIHRAVSDLRSFSELLPADCATDWAFGASTRGTGAKARVTYTFGPLRRKLTANVVDDQSGRLWRVDHDNDKKGFFIQTTYQPTAKGEDLTSVVLTTPLNPPPWPLKPSFYKKVLPAWEDCYERTMQNLSARVTGG